MGIVNRLLADVKATYKVTTVGGVTVGSVFLIGLGIPISVLLRAPAGLQIAAIAFLSGLALKTARRIGQGTCDVSAHGWPEGIGIS